MSAFLQQEPELVWGFAAILLGWAGIVMSDTVRRAKGKDRRTTSPVAQWIASIVLLSALAIVAIWSWTASGRSLSMLGFRAGSGTGLGIAWGLAAGFIGLQLVQLRAVIRDETVRDTFRKTVFDSGDYDQIMPRRRADAWGFFAVGVTAGITEEIVFRAFLISLFTLLMPLWLAGVLALVLFVLGHAYQGVQGFIRILPISVLLTLTYVLSGSLWPGIALHIAVDVLSGVMVWAALPREGYVEVSGIAEAPAEA